MTESEEPQGKRLAPPVRRLVIATGLLLVFWLVFLQITPRAMLQLAPPQTQPQAVTEAPPALPLPPVPAPEAAKAEEPLPPPVQLKPIEEEQEAAEVDAEAVARMRTMEEKLDRLMETAVRGQAESQDMRALREKLEAHEQAIEELRASHRAALRALALMDGYDRLKDRVLTGKPFAEELDRLQLLAGDDGKLTLALDDLRPLASAGIPRLESLRAAFDSAARRALLPPVNKDAGVVEKLAANFSSVVSVRRVGQVAGEAPDAVIARAEAALGKGDVDKAASEVASLQNKAGAAMQSWLGDAKAYLVRDSALDQIKSAIAALKPAG